MQIGGVLHPYFCGMLMPILLTRPRLVKLRDTRACPSLIREAIQVVHELVVIAMNQQRLVPTVLLC